MNIEKLYSLVQKNTKKGIYIYIYIYQIKEHFASKLCLTIFNGIKIAIKKSEQQNLKYPYAHQHTQWQKKETKIILMVK